MQVLVLSKEGGLKLKRREKALYKKDFLDLSRSLLPGEWCLFFNEKTGEHYAGFVNLHAKENWPVAFMVDVVEGKSYEAWSLLQNKIEVAIHYRDHFNFDGNSRLVYGEGDELPGLIVDQFENYLLIQINTAGMDKFRSEIKTFFERKYPKQKVLLYDQKSYREAESLPEYAAETLSENLRVKENGLKLEVSSDHIQKIGYYFDHRSNREKARNLLSKMVMKKDTGLDLFSYVGSWGLHLLSAGIKKVDFVDQGNFESAILKNTELNGFGNRASFKRADCFLYLDEAITTGKSWDVICSDPPAFTKNSQGKIKALEGYLKLHTKVLKCLAPEGLALIGSCTHYVNLEELDQTMQEAAARAGRKIKLLDLGLQSFDHPIKGMNDKGNYIKYLAYYVA